MRIVEVACWSKAVNRGQDWLLWVQYMATFFLHCCLYRLRVVKTRDSPQVSEVPLLLKGSFFLAVSQTTQSKQTHASNMVDAKEYYEDQKHLMKLCDFLRSGDGPAVREAIEMDKRVYYIKGEFAVKK